LSLGDWVQARYVYMLPAGYVVSDFDVWIDAKKCNSSARKDPIFIIRSDPTIFSAQAGRGRRLLPGVAATAATEWLRVSFAESRHPPRFVLTIAVPIKDEPG